MFISEEEFNKRINHENNFARPKEPTDSSPRDNRKDTGKEENPAKVDESQESAVIATVADSSSENENGNGRGRHKGDSNVPSEIRALIGAAAASHVDTADGLAKTFGVSKRSISNYKNGKGLTEGGVEKKESMLVRVQETALMKTMMIMGMITEKDLKEIKKDRARSLISIAQGFATIHEKIAPNANRNGQQQAIVIFRDNGNHNNGGGVTKDESEYEVTEIEAQVVE